MLIAYNYSTYRLKHIRPIVPSDEPAVKPNKSVRLNDRSNEKCQGSPCGLPDVHPSKYRRKIDKRRTDQSTSIDQWERSVRGIKPWKRLTQTPLSDNDGREVHGTYMIRVCAAAKPRRLTI